MSLENKKEHLISSFLDSLYIEKGLSKNTANSYKNDISSFFIWLNSSSLNPLNVSAVDINNYVSKLFGDGLKGSFVIFLISATIFLSNPFLVFIPVPTAVPPWARK